MLESGSGKYMYTNDHDMYRGIDLHKIYSIMSDVQDHWKVELDQTWDVLGPFPIHAREQHYLSPAFPLNLEESIDYLKTWPSAYADGGRVGWKSTQLREDGSLHVKFPEIRWNCLRATEGWAALQHHAILRTTLTLHPSQVPSVESLDIPLELQVHLRQASYFTLRPMNYKNSSFHPVWYAGNIYDLERTLPQIVPLSVTNSTPEPIQFDLFVSGDYEIRLFGDPHAQNSEVPTLVINMDVAVNPTTNQVIHEPSQDVICDFVGGYSFGEAIGVGVRASTGWWTVVDVALGDKISAENIKIRLLCTTQIAPSQSRIVPIVIRQEGPFKHENLPIELTLFSDLDNAITTVSVSLPVTHLKLWTSMERRVIRGSYFYAQSMPTTFIAVSPVFLGLDKPRPPILALHGAGVDILQQDFWIRSLPKNKYSWMVVPTGRTSWGLDWHGPSAKDAFDSVNALSSVLSKRPDWSLNAPPVNMPVVAIGHSNGGQGVWYLASRYPDRVLAIVPAAGYIKSQSYVPLTFSRSAHFIDPALRAILESSFTADDNDLHLSNLVGTPILAIHGGDDDNVPVWHSREAVSVLQEWLPSANVSFREDQNQGHWYPSVLDNAQVQDFLDSYTNVPKGDSPSVKEFTLTVYEPRDCGSLYGWKIECVLLPGRLARLHVDLREPHLSRITTTNISGFSLALKAPSSGSHVFHVDCSSIDVPADIDSVVYFERTTNGHWEIANEPLPVPPPSRIQSILSSPAPITIVIPSTSRSPELSSALRIAHDLNAYHRIDAEIVDESEALARSQIGSWSDGNIIFIGTSSSPFVEAVIEEKRTAMKLCDGRLVINERHLEQPGEAVLFLHPHPAKQDASMLFMVYTDASSLERATRLLPIRTGVAVPDWLVTIPLMDRYGAAGIKAAGLWSNNWDLNLATAWFS